MTNVYSIDVKVWATAYIRAATPEEAVEKLRKLRYECLQMPVDEFEVGEDRVPVSERSFDDPELPELSLATNMSVDSEYIDSVAPDELELSHESLGAEADASCQVHQENGSPDWA